MQICGICGRNHCPTDCDIVQVISHAPDKSIPSKARQTIPEDLELRETADNCEIVALCTIEKGTQFGPLQAKRLDPVSFTTSFPLKVFYLNCEGSLSDYYIDTNDENECNWMMFVNPASNFQDQNTICYQDGEDIYYVTVRDIYEGEALKVWYSPYYAIKMQKNTLKPIINKDTEQLKDTSIDLLVRNKKNITSRETWSCKFCGKMEKNLSEFALHLVQHYHEKSSRYCQICKVSFLKIQGFQKHMKTVHETEVTINSKGQLEQKSNAFQESDKNVSESLAKDNYSRDPVLLNELLSDSIDNTTLVLCSNTNINQMDLTGIENQNNLFDNENLNLNLESILPVKSLEFEYEPWPNENEQFVCDICLKNFKTLKAMMVHMNLHTGKFTCFECNKVFARKENLLHHACKTFFKFKCAYCNKWFFQHKYLTLHVKTAHENTCTSCKQMFGTKEKLKAHQCPKKNTSKIKYPCTQCYKEFTHKNNLIIHLKHHQRSREEFNCSVCNKVLTSHKTYLKHYKLHEGHRFACDMCEKVFPRQDTLKAHKDLVHSTRNLEICQICKKTYKSKKLLKEHMHDLHEGKVYPCQHCSLRFKQEKNLKRHIKKCHQMNKSITSILSNMEKQFSCPKCDKKLKFRNSVKRHIATAHPEYDKAFKMEKVKYKKQTNLTNQVEDLKQTIENMNYNTDEINHEITIEIDKLLNNPENFASDSNDRLMESFINTSVSDNNLEEKSHQKDVMLSMPDLDDLDHISLERLSRK